MRGGYPLALPERLPTRGQWRPILVPRLSTRATYGAAGIQPYSATPSFPACGAATFLKAEPDAQRRH